MKLLATTDLHQREDKWRQLVENCKKESPDIICIAGDLFPKNVNISAQKQFLKHIIKYAKKIKEMNCKLVLILGNDDNKNIEVDMKKLDEEGVLYYVSDSVREIDGYEFIGFPWVLDYPFLYKYWIKPESKTDLHISELQYGEPLTINDDNSMSEIENYKEFLSKREDIATSLSKLAEKVKNMSKSIWLIHCPPYGCGLDHCASGYKAGSKSIYEFIVKNQPLLTIHGHIHESPHYSFVWKKNIGNTTTIQPGQIDNKLHYVTFKIEGDKIMEVNHNIYAELPA